MKRKIIIVSLIILGISMLSGGVLVIANFFGSSGDISKGLVGHWKMDNIGAGGAGEIPFVEEGLVGHWKFNGDATDATSNDNDGTVAGAVLTIDREGQSNKAYSFDGVDDYIDLGSNAVTDFTSGEDFTLGVWINPDSATVGSIISNEVLNESGYSLIFTKNRNIAFVVGGTVTSSLKMELDAANTNSYSGSGSTWSDLSGNGNNGTLSSSVDFVSDHGGAMSVLFTPTNPNEEIRNAGSFSLASGVTTVELMYESTVNVGGDSSHFGMHNGSMTHTGIRFQGTTWQVAVNNSWVDVSLSPGNLNNPGRVVQSIIKRNGTAFEIYLDGASAGTATGSSGTNTYTGWALNDKNYTVSGAGMTGRYHILRLYSKALSATEVEQNFQSVAYRYDLVNNATTTDTVSLNQYSLIVVKKTGTTCKIFINAALSKTFTCSISQNLNGNLMIGKRPSGVNEYFSGKIDDVRIYDRALSDSEITEIYNSYGGISTAEDSTPNNNDGTIAGASLTTDRKGQSNEAYDFNGTTSDYISITSSMIQDLVADSTKSVTAWIQLDTTTATEGRVVGVMKQYGSTRWGLGWARLAGDKKLFVSYNNGDTHSQLKSTAEYDSTDGWVHLAGVQNGTSIKIYINGVEDNSASDASTVAVGTAADTCIGCYFSAAATPASYWNGMIDDLRLYDRALSQAEITSLYDSYNPGVAISSINKGLIGHWKMDGTEEDSTPYSNDGDGAIGADITTDRKGQANKAYDFVPGNSDDMVVNSNAVNLDVGTITGWFSPDFTLESIGDHFFFGTSSNHILYFEDAINGLRFYNDTRYTDFTNIPWTTGVFSHYAFVYNKTGNVQKLYVNGVEQTGETPIGTWGSTAIGASFWIGSNDGSSSFFDGKMDDIRTYNRALTQAEITRLYDSYNSGISISSLQKGLIGHWKMDNTGAISPQSGLVGHWKFNGNAKDISSSGNDGTVTGATLTTDRKIQSNKSYSFNGTTDFIAMNGLASTVAANNTGSVSMWVKFDSGAAPDTFFSVSKGDATNYLQMNIVSSDKISVQMIGGAGTMWQKTTSATFNDAWHHVVIVQDAVAPKLYVDGVEPALQTDVNSGDWFNDLSGLAYGRVGNIRYNGEIGNISATIDEVRVYNQALTADEVTELYNSYDPMAEDATPQSNDGTLSGGQTYTNDSTTDRKGQSNKALNFDGTSDFVDVGATSQNIKTISYWINADSDDETVMDLDGLGTSGNYIISNGFFSGGSISTTYIDGVEMTLGSEIVVNGGFDSDATGWVTSVDNTLESVTGGVSGNALKFTDGVGGGSGRWFSCATSSSGCWNVTIGKFYKFSVYQKNGTNSIAPGPYTRIGATWAGAQYRMFYDEDNNDWRHYSDVFKATTTKVHFIQYTRTLITENVFFDEYSLKEVTSPISASAWHHVVVTMDTAISASDVDFGLEGSTYLDGKLDDIRFYNRVLTTAEITRLYESYF